MRKLIYLVITYIVCHFLGLGDVWLGFAPAMLIMLLGRLSDSLLWEIPMGTLACGICITAMGDDIAALLRILIPCAAVIIAYSSPKRLVFFFPAAICALFFKNVYSAAVLCASLWCGVKLLFMKKPLPKYSTTGKEILQAGTD